MRISLYQSPIMPRLGDGAKRHSRRTVNAIFHLAANSLGWRDLEQKVADAFRKLTPDEQKRVAIIAANCGQAAAIDVYGKADGLPPALSGHNQYWLWGPRGYDGSLAIHVGGDLERWRRGCGSLDIVGRTDNAFAMPYENNRPIFICRGLRVPITELWDRFKRYR
jgi:hypothetical protein